MTYPFYARFATRTVTGLLVFLSVGVLAQTTPARKPTTPATRPATTTPTSTNRAVSTGATKLATARKPEVIYRLDKTTVEAYVTEIDGTTISYRKASNPSGPIYKVKATEVEYIRYANGEIERYNDAMASRPAPVAAPETMPAAALASERPTTAPAPTRPTAAPRPASQSMSRTSSSSSRPTTTSAPARPTKSQPSRSASAGSEKKDGGLFITAGGGFSNVKSEGGVTNTTSDNIINYRGGIGFMIPIAGPILVAPTAEYVMMGAKQNVFGTDVKAEVNFGVLTLPIMFQSGDSDSPIRVIGGVGPYAAYGINGKGTVGTVTTDVTFSEKEGDDRFKRLHFGAAGNLGVRFGPISVYGYYTQSFTNLTAVPTTSTAKDSFITYGAALRFHL
jgi:hypothetical protein